MLVDPCGTGKTQLYRPPRVSHNPSEPGRFALSALGFRKQAYHDLFFWLTADGFNNVFLVIVFEFGVLSLSDLSSSINHIPFSSLELFWYLFFTSCSTGLVLHGAVVTETGCAFHIPSPSWPQLS